MSILVVPDVHERLDRLAAALSPARLARAERVIFLGDWFDAFGPIDLDRVRWVCRFLNDNCKGIFFEGSGPEDVGRMVPATFLLGNHDCHYFFRHSGFRCSGYTPAKQAVIDEMLDGETIRQFHIFTKAHGWLLSHAGFRNETIDMADTHVEQDVLQIARQGLFDALFAAGQARGGSALYGGPTWLDWHYEFEPVDGVKQIVGHTNGREVRQRGDNYCIDTACRHVAWIEKDGAVTIEATQEG